MAIRHTSARIAIAGAAAVALAAAASAPVLAEVSAEPIFLWDEQSVTAPAGLTKYSYEPTYEWAITAARPDSDSVGTTMTMFEDRVRVARSAQPDGVEIIATYCEGCGEYVFDSFYPVVRNLGGTSTVEVAHDPWFLSPGGGFSHEFEESDVVRLYNFIGGKKGSTYTLTLDSTGDSDLDLYLFYGTAPMEYQTAADAVASSNTAPAGGTETITFTAEKIYEYGVAVVQESGSGSFELDMSKAAS